VATEFLNIDCGKCTLKRDILATMSDDGRLLPSSIRHRTRPVVGFTNHCVEDDVHVYA